MPGLRCESCSMLVDDGRYCEHCVDELGALQSFAERLKRMTIFIRSREPERGEAEAEEQARAFMQTMPAWRNHPELKVIPGASPWRRVSDPGA